MNDQKRLSREILFTWICLLFLGFSAALGFADAGHLLMEKFAHGSAPEAMKQALFVFLVASLFYGGVVYQVCRLGYLYRRRAHQAAKPEGPHPAFKDDAPPVTVLIPSYCEEHRIIWQTVLSACLQDYPNKRIVLLIDNPPNPRDELDRISLELARRVPAQMNHLFGGIHSKIQEQWHAYLARSHGSDDQSATADEFQDLAELYDTCGRWCRARANEYQLSDHSDRFFTDHVLMSTVRILESQARELAARAGGSEAATDIRAGYHRLLGLFKVDVSSFERKQYINLSHAPNKAMNLNSYLRLIGGSFRQETHESGKHLCEVTDASGLTLDLMRVPDAKYCVTLDADSILLPNYISRLVSILEHPENRDLAVIQTPYSAFPRSPSTLEKLAGATTDIQYIIHQGFTAFNSTFWVGANAVLRREALIDISEEVMERGHKVMRYIHDHTVIEDTESTIDLVSRGWRLYNYPERLAYSATPPDFGALLIQRRRWANGGLLIFPKLFRSMLSVRKFLANPAMHVAEGLIRSHYLLSIAIVNIGLLIMLGYSFEDCATSPWLPLTALPYYLLYARDLRLNGYRYSDIIQVYALNLVLIPINLGGVFKSIHQGITGTQTPFARTPKVAGRTAAPWGYAALEVCLVVFWGGCSIYGFANGFVLSSSFALAHSLILAYGICKFIGLKELLEDLLPHHSANQPLATVHPLPSKQRKDERPRKSA